MNETKQKKKYEIKTQFCAVRKSITRLNREACIKEEIILSEWC